MNKLIYDGSKALGRFLFGAFLEVRSSGLDDLPEGACLLVCNHISHFDPPLAVWAIRRRIEFMTMQELFQPRWFAAWLRLVGCFEVDRSRFDIRAARTALRRLEAGGCVAIFPEGGIRTGADSILQGAPFPSNIAEMARVAGCPVRTCLILGTDRLYSWKNWFKRPRLHIVGGGQFKLDHSLSKREARDTLTAAIRNDFQQLYRRVIHTMPETMVPRPAQERWTPSAEEMPKSMQHP